ncbi:MULTISPECIES: hypothetical protein, partial [unclassified Polaromonas]|uniref:hypothetical protein n=1 Tax=unclassified Polaromonas TaxID=2638319 RepID=UPI001E2DBB2C
APASAFLHFLFPSFFDRENSIKFILHWAVSITIKFARKNNLITPSFAMAWPLLNEKRMEPVEGIDALQHITGKSDDRRCLLRHAARSQHRGAHCPRRSVAA